MSSRPVISLKLQESIKDGLIRCGYESVADLLSTTPASIADDLKITVEEAEAILQQINRPSTQNLGMPLTQSVAAVIKSTPKFSTQWPPLDKLLDGGLTRGHILEVSGPPGSPKEDVAIDVATSFIEGGENVIFVDCQNMTLPSKLRDRLSGYSTSSLRSLHYSSILDAAAMMIFLHSITSILESMPKVTLLVLNSFSFPFSTLQNPRKAGILDQVKQILTRVSVTKNLTIVITSHLATKILKEDGTYGTFEEGGKGMMVPQLGPSYLPSGRSRRVVLSLESPISGVMYLLPSPSSTTTTNHVRQEPYSIPLT